MNENELLIFNFEEVRRRSKEVYNAIPYNKLRWRLDEESMNYEEIIRQVLAKEYNFFKK
jgi:hypothetical protein